MPVYVYRNLTTGETFEVEQRITESAWTEHPASGDPVKRIVQPVGIAFKGSGFYVTDSRGKAKAKGPAEAKPAASSNGESGKSDAAAKASDAPKTATKSTPAGSAKASKD